MKELLIKYFVIEDQFLTSMEIKRPKGGWIGNELSEALRQLEQANLVTVFRTMCWNDSNQSFTRVELSLEAQNFLHGFCKNKQ